MRVLIAEDDSTSRTILNTFLKKWGYETVAVNTGKAALDVFYQPGAPRLAILDWMMPEMDGLEVVRRGPCPGSRPTAVHHHADH